MALSSLTAGISGLRSAQTALNVTGNNLANLNTSGFKSSRVSFSDELSQTLKSAQAPTGSVGGKNAIQIGIGSAVGSIDTNFAQGSITPTGRPFDLAIQGEGFFIVTDGSQDFYTRVGSFGLDMNNDLVDSGTGYKVKNILGRSLNLPVSSIVPAKATTAVSLAGNLNSNLAAGAVNQVLTTASALNSKLTGTIDPTASTTLTGVGTAFNSELAVGDLVTVSGETRTITAIASDTSLTVSAAFTDTANDASPVANAKTTTAINSLDETTTPYVAGDVIKVVGTESDGTNVSTDFVYGAGTNQNGTTLGDLQSFITASFGTATASLDTSGNLVLTSDSPGKSNLLMSLSDASTNTGAATLPTINVSTTGAGESYVTTIPVFDTQGTSHPITLAFEKTSSNAWDVTPTMKASDGSVVDGISTISFNQNGSFSSVTGTPNLTITFSNGNTQTVNLDLGVSNAFNGLTQFSGNSSVATTSQDGFEAGFFLSSTVNQNGAIDALFTNGQTKNIGQLQLAAFSNPNGLSKQGDNLFAQTAASGTSVLSTALSGKFGSIVGGALEGSNVDIAEEFTNLIINQRAFQANARTITTTDDILQELVNLVR